ncbi:MAG: LL-diaminopimelate aminotransferase [Deltaproteobacteria bacterium]|nr:LL-diaminopimelate aminotransferase [Deltaproteobacteria bacterium]MBW2361329.1 LL-diaminopimelate aminotransferase [Deltaproteobacteria bacterium]
MARINDDYEKLQAGYLFPEIGRRVAAFQSEHPDASVIRLGIGDVTLPLAPAVVQALHDATDEMGTAEGFRGYGPERGAEDFLLEGILEHDFTSRGVTLAKDEIFVSDGSKQDSGNIQEIFGRDCHIAVTDPVYPVYVDTNVMAGRTGAAGDSGRFAGILYLPATEENGFVPPPPDAPADIAYLCSPNNPTGSVASHAALAEWVAWAREHDAVIIYDAAYDAFIQDPSLPHSIYEVDGAKECAIEMRSFSKRAGFTGVRCAYTVVPHGVTGSDAAGQRVPLNGLWLRRHCTKFNGVPYVVQRAAGAVFSPEGRKQTQEQVAHYMSNAAYIRTGLTDAGFVCFGGEHAPYVWVRTPQGLSSWDCFDRILGEANVVTTPGSGFGASGEGYFRISAFNSRENVEAAVSRIQRAFAG